MPPYTEQQRARLMALLRESKREHLHCDDSFYCCGACRSSDHGLAEGETVGVGWRRDGGGACTCGAAEWNDRVDAELETSQ